MNKLFILRGGAPDKFNLSWDGFESVRLDGINLIDLIECEVEQMASDGYILPADEGDFKAYHRYPESVRKRILLPDLPVSNINLIRKDSILYTEYLEGTPFRYPDSISLTFDELRELRGSTDPMVLKCPVGSGSRGVVVVDPGRYKPNSPYLIELHDKAIESLIEFAELNGQTSILKQRLIKDKIKINVDFVIRDGELVTYKWTEMNQSQQFTNWDWGYFIKNGFTDKVMKYIPEILCKAGIKNAIMNFEGYTDYDAYVDLIEFNFRYSNSMFEWKALNINPIDLLVNPNPDLTSIRLIESLSDARLKFSRNWRCDLYTKHNLDNYHG